MLSLLHRITNCSKNGTALKKCLLQPMPASCCSVALNYFQTGLSIFFNTFLETQKAQMKRSTSGLFALVCFKVLFGSKIVLF